MGWFKRLFGGDDVEAAKEPPKAEAPAKAAKVETWSGKKIAARFARSVPGARTEDFDGRNRADGLLARVTYTHEGAEARIAVYLVDGEFAVWLETRAPGVFGSFDILHGVPAEDDPDFVERIYLAPKRFLFGPRVRNEMARIQMLGPKDFERLVALSDRVTVVKLDEEVVSLRLGDDAFDFIATLQAADKGVPYVLALGAEAASLARALPPESKDVVALAEARACNFCKASFVFSPASPVCTNCGAPATKASILPPPAPEEIPDDPVLGDDEFDPGEREEVMTEVRAMAAELAARVPGAVIRGEPDRVRVFVEYELDGRAFRAKFMQEKVGLRTAARGAGGDFYLMWVDDAVYGDADNAAAWCESERRVFFSTHCCVSSRHTTREAARLASIPSEARAKLLAMCEEFEGGVQLEDERLAVALGHRVHERGVDLVLETSRALGPIADAIPRSFDDRGSDRFRIASCAFCGWAYFAATDSAGCVHCGAA